MFTRAKKLPKTIPNTIKKPQKGQTVKKNRFIYRIQTIRTMPLQRVEMKPDTIRISKQIDTLVRPVRVLYSMNEGVAAVVRKTEKKRIDALLDMKIRTTKTIGTEEGMRGAVKTLKMMTGTEREVPGKMTEERRDIGMTGGIIEGIIGIREIEGVVGVEIGDVLGRPEGLQGHPEGRQEGPDQDLEIEDLSHTFPEGKKLIRGWIG